MTTHTSPVAPDARRPIGPHAGALALITTVLVVAAVALPSVLTGQPGYVLPTASAGEVQSYFATSSDAARLTAMFQFAGAVPLGILTATFYAHLLRLGIKVPGPSIAFYGGTVASGLMLVSSGALWAAAELGGSASGDSLRALTLLAFATGGSGYLVGLGLLIAGVAVPVLVLRLVPRALGFGGLVIAAICELSTLDLLTHVFDPLLPIGRFAALVWLVALGFLLPKSVRRRNAGGRFRASRQQAEDATVPETAGV